MSLSDRIKPISYLKARHERRQEAVALKMLELDERRSEPERYRPPDGRCRLRKP